LEKGPNCPHSGHAFTGRERGKRWGKKTEHVNATKLRGGGERVMRNSRKKIRKKKEVGGSHITASRKAQRMTPGTLLLKKTARKMKEEKEARGRPLKFVRKKKKKKKKNTSQEKKENHTQKKKKKKEEKKKNKF